MSSNLPSCRINLQKLDIIHESPEKMSKEELPDIKVSIVDEATEETTSNEKSEDEIDKTEIDEELIEESIKVRNSKCLHFSSLLQNKNCFLQF